MGGPCPLDAGSEPGTDFINCLNNTPDVESSETCQWAENLPFQCSPPGPQAWADTPHWDLRGQDICGHRRWWDYHLNVSLNFRTVFLNWIILFTGATTNGHCKWQVPVSTWVNPNMTEDWDKGMTDHTVLFLLWFLYTECIYCVISEH